MQKNYKQFFIDFSYINVTDKIITIITHDENVNLFAETWHNPVSDIFSMTK